MASTFAGKGLELRSPESLLLLELPQPVDNTDRQFSPAFHLVRLRRIDEVRLLLVDLNPHAADLAPPHLAAVFTRLLRNNTVLSLQLAPRGLLRASGPPETMSNLGPPALAVGALSERRRSLILTRRSTLLWGFHVRGMVLAAERIKVR